MCFLVGTLVGTWRARMEVTKMSSLATMCALDDSTRQYLEGSYNFNDMKNQAKAMVVSLDRGGSGVRLGLISR